MRQTLTLKFLVVAVLTALTGAFLLWFYAQGGESATKDAVRRKIDKGALILEVGTDSDWKIESGRTRGDMVLLLNDGTTVNITPRTMGTNQCDELKANECVLLADMLGPAVVWFAIVDADKSASGSNLTLPGLVDMEDGGDTGVLENGWMLPLATPTVRYCSVTTSNLRDFINRYPNEMSNTNFNLKTDQIDSVKCVED